MVLFGVAKYCVNWCVALCCKVLFSLCYVVLYSVVRRQDKCIESSDDLRVDT